jgi:hypothetical protein
MGILRSGGGQKGTMGRPSSKAMYETLTEILRFPNAFRTARKTKSEKSHKKKNIFLDRTSFSSSAKEKGIIIAGRDTL